ncbi:MAG: hypothetical protein IV103_20385 [Zoogloea sp.]|nr:hypothetical protein [Zoogloea sp.]
MSTHPAGIVDSLRVRLSPETEMFLGSLHDSSGKLHLLFDGNAPETQRLRWTRADLHGNPDGYVPWARISCGTLLVTAHDVLRVQSNRLLVDLAEFSPGSASAHCPTLRLSARLIPLGPDDLALRQAFERGPSPLAQDGDTRQTHYGQ